jgi:hypothetical protein
MGESFGGFLADALAGIQRDAPACAAVLASSLAATDVVVRVDGETMTLRTVGGRLELVAGGGDSAADSTRGTARLVTTSGALLGILEGRTSLLCAVKSNAVCVSATPAGAAQLFDALRVFVEGVARSRDSVSAYERFRAQVVGTRWPRGGDA